MVVKAIQTNSVSEIKSLMDQLQQDEILYRVMCTHTSQKNKVIECRHRHTIERDMALLFTAHMLITLWLYIVQTATFLINTLPIKSCLVCLLLRYYMKSSYI